MSALTRCEPKLALGRSGMSGRILTLETSVYVAPTQVSSSGDAWSSIGRTTATPRVWFDLATGEVTFHKEGRLEDPALDGDSAHLSSSE